MTTDRWNWMAVAIGDAVFGWALSLPRDFAIVLVGIVLAILLLAVRRLTTDRTLLQQIAADRRRLREQIRAAIAAGDQESVARYHRLRRLVAQRRAHAEALAIGVSILILAAVMSWGKHRLDYLPIPSSGPFQLVARLPAAMIGEVVHVVPTADVTAEKGWLRTVQAAVDAGVPCGRAEWTFRVLEPQKLNSISLRLRQQTAIHRIVAGAPTYENPIQNHPGGVQTEVRLTPYRPLGILPSRIWPGLPGWSLLLTMVTGGIYWFGNRQMKS